MGMTRWHRGSGEGSLEGLIGCTAGKVIIRRSKTTCGQFKRVNAPLLLTHVIAPRMRLSYILALNPLFNGCNSSFKAGSYLLCAPVNCSTPPRQLWSEGETGGDEQYEEVVVV